MQRFEAPTNRHEIADFATKCFIAYNEIGIAVREGFAADYAPINPTGPIQTPADQSPSIRQLTAVDGRGLTIGEKLGVTAQGNFDWATGARFDESGWLLAQCVNKTGSCDVGVPTAASNAPLDQRYRFDVYGNLKRQWHSGAWMQNGAPQSANRATHDYVYDKLHRLTQHTRAGAPGNGNGTVDINYDDIGNILSKSDIASSSNAYSYVPGKDRLNAVSLSAGGSVSIGASGHDANGNVIQRIDPTGTTTIDYDIDNLAYRMIRGGTRSDFYQAPGGRYLQRHTSGTEERDTWMLDKTMEREIVGGSVTIERYYIAGHLLTIKADAVEANRRKLNYLHTDRLGSPVSITEKRLAGSGNIVLGNEAVSTSNLVEHKGFDPFGKAYDGQWGSTNQSWLTWNGSGLNQGKRNQRGFTGHEHLDEFKLIHMNGRIYDQDLGRFLGVDPIIQFPSNSQSLNPYAYLMNNPLAGTDPTGYAGVDLRSICGSHPSACSFVKYSLESLKAARQQAQYDNGAALGTALKNIIIELTKPAETINAPNLRDVETRNLYEPMQGVVTQNHIIAAEAALNSDNGWLERLSYGALALATLPLSTGESLVSEAYNAPNGVYRGTQEVTRAFMTPEQEERVEASLGAAHEFSKSILGVLGPFAAMGPKPPVAKETPVVSGADTADDIVIDSYSSLRGNGSIPGQAHHLNQVAAFRDVIPRSEGLSIKLVGNILTDAAAPHTLAHRVLEGFWNGFRGTATVPTNLQYTRALQQSLRAAGLSEAQVQKAVRAAIGERVRFNLLGGMEVPRVPGPIRNIAQ
jgi:RHS repeat-associated protein